MRNHLLLVFFVLAAVTTAMGLVAIWLVAKVVPIPDGMDVSQKIFYFHVPSAIAMYAGIAMCTLSSFLFLIWRNERWDAAGKTGAELATLFCVVVLITGPIWAAQAWGAPWVWDPRLTSVAFLGLILAAYHLVRAVGEDSPAARRLAAALGVLAAPNAYLIHAAVRMWGGQHPTVIYERSGLDPTIRAVFLLCIATALVLCTLLAWWRLDLELTRRRAARLEVEAMLGSG
jgi:heme exporter protein C